MINSNRICITHIGARPWYNGLVLTGAPQTAAMIIGFSNEMHDLMNGEYWTVAGDPAVRLQPDEQSSRNSRKS